MKTHIVPNRFREIALTDTMKKSLIFKTTTRTKSLRGHIPVVEQKESGNKIMACQPKKEFKLFR